MIVKHIHSLSAGMFQNRVLDTYIQFSVMVHSTIDSLFFRKTTAAAVYCLNTLAKIRLITTVNSSGYYVDILGNVRSKLLDWMLVGLWGIGLPML